ncbi:MAG: hypothetical protein ABII07_01700 [Patescibacteria group bacterium]|nr:hypothetical protein [Patescibacteria group bacterium]
MLITIYGTNNMGKTTHAKLLVEKLEAAGKKAKYVKYPVYDLEPTGPYLNRILRSGESQNITEEELQMWFALNRYQFQPELKKWLADGYIVVAEDYIGTGVAWGTAKGADPVWLERLNQFLIQEDLAILIDGDRVESAMEALHIHERNDDLIRKCRQVLQDLAEKHQWRTVLLQDRKEDTAELVWGVVSEAMKYGRRF